MRFTVAIPTRANRFCKSCRMNWSGSGCHRDWMKRDSGRGWLEQLPKHRFFAALMKRFEGHGEVTEAEVASILQEFGSEVHNTREVLEVVGRWFTYFLHEPHETARDTVKLIKAKRVGSASVQ